MEVPRRYGAFPESGSRLFAHRTGSLTQTVSFLSITSQTIVAAVPMGEERKTLNAHFDTLLSDLQERGLLTEQIEEIRKPERKISAPGARKTSNARSIASAGQGRRVRYEQMTFEDLLFSAESRKQDPSHDGRPVQEPTR